jgi:flagellar hook-basal body complex protein FliE
MTIASMSAIKAYQAAVKTDTLLRKGPAAPDLTKLKSGQAPSGDFTTTLKDSLEKVNAMQGEKASMIEEFASGKTQNVHELMITLQKAGLAMKLTSTVRAKVLEAYRELSHMSF